MEDEKEAGAIIGVIDEFSESATTGKLVEALAKAQGAFGPVVRDRKVSVDMTKGGSYSYKYAELADFIEATRKPLSENGLAIIQRAAFRGHEVWVHTRLGHSSGEWCAVLMVWELPEVAKIQDAGTVITYLRRYARSALLDIAADEDSDATNTDEGANMRGGQPRASPPPDLNNVPEALYDFEKAVHDAETLDELRDACYPLVNKFPAPLRPMAAALYNRKLAAFKAKATA